MGEIKLHLGCGNLHLEGWVNIDWNASEYTDIVDDVSTLTTFQENTVDEIYACHVLEHFGLVSSVEQPRCIDVLKRWNSLLKPGGILYVSVPNILSILKGIDINVNNLNITYDFLRCCYGGQDYKGNTHYCGFTPLYLSSLLQQSNFSNISEFESFVNDTSKFAIANIPISLNLKAFKI